MKHGDGTNCLGESCAWRGDGEHRSYPDDTPDFPGTHRVITDQQGRTITPTPTEPTSMYYEIPVVFVVNAKQYVPHQKDATGEWGGGYWTEGSERDAAEIVCSVVSAGVDSLTDDDASAGQADGCEVIDAWTLPANQDVTGADNRSGTIVYGADCEYLADLCRQRAEYLEDPESEESQRAARLADYLSRYTFDGA